MNWYKWLWSRIGGRPWTYIIRDTYEAVPYLWLIGAFTLGVFYGHFHNYTSTLYDILKVTTGFLLGHLFWGTRHIWGQKGR